MTLQVHVACLLPIGIRQALFNAIDNRGYVR